MKSLCFVHISLVRSARWWKLNRFSIKWHSLSFVYCNFIIYFGGSVQGLWNLWRNILKTSLDNNISFKLFFQIESNQKFVIDASPYTVSK